MSKILKFFNLSTEDSENKKSETGNFERDENISFDAQKPQKKNFFVLTIILSALLFLALVVLISVLATKSNRSVLKLSSVLNEEKTENLISLDSFSKKAFIKKSGQACFKFSARQKETFEKVYNEHSSAALTLRIQVFEDDDKILSGNESLKIGFLAKEDFKSSSKLYSQDFSKSEKIIILADEKTLLRSTDGQGIIDLSFALKKPASYSDSDYKNECVPEGFFVLSSLKCKILQAAVTQVQLGFDLTSEIPFYSFAPNGGVVDFNAETFDFSGATSVFVSKNSKDTLMPEYEVTFCDDQTLKSTLQNPVRIALRLGGERLSLCNVPSASKVLIPSSALKNPYAEMEIGQNSKMIKSVILKDSEKSKNSDTEIQKVISPIKTDPGLILRYPVNSWRISDYELFEWDRFPGILFFDTKNYDVQDKFFRRMAYFVEKAGYKGTLVSDSELEGKHGYNAHDYKAESMAEFFNKAADENFPLNNEELSLKEILIQNGLLEADGNHVKAIKGAVISISQETLPGTRYNLLAHEGWHTLFFTDEEFRNYVSAVYYTMDPFSKDFLIEYFKSQPSLGYDTSDEYLMQNEFMAYVLQSPLEKVSEYFVNHAKWNTVQKFTPELSAYVVSTNGQGFEDAANALNEFVFDKYGVVCGNIALVRR